MENPDLLSDHTNKTIVEIMRKDMEDGPLFRLVSRAKQEELGLPTALFIAPCHPPSPHQAPPPHSVDALTYAIETFKLADSPFVQSLRSLPDQKRTDMLSGYYDELTD